jgi:hypothetical protein
MSNGGTNVRMHRHEIARTRIGSGVLTRQNVAQLHHSAVYTPVPLPVLGTSVSADERTCSLTHLLNRRPA